MTSSSPEGAVRPSPTVRGLLLTVLVVAALVLAATPGLVAPADAARLPRTRITGTVPSTAYGNQPFVISGKIKPRSRNRDVQVQVLRGGTWAILARTRTTKQSTYTVAASLPEGVSKVRLVARAKRARIGSTKPRTVRVLPDPDRGSRLAAGSSLTAGQYLRSPSGRYRLVMQPDGDLVLLDGASKVWSIGSVGAGRRLVLQADGNLVVVGDAGLGWQTATTGFDGSELVVQDDGNVVVSSRGLATWARTAGYLGDVLPSGAVMQPGASRRSPGGRYWLRMQADGNFVVYDGTTALWSTGTSGDNFAILQTDGNLGVYPRAGGSAVYNAGVVSPGAVLKVQDDSNVVIYQGATAVWSWRTGKI